MTPRKPSQLQLAAQLMRSFGHTVDVDQQIVYDPTEHRYWQGGVEMVGVNRVLRCVGLVDASFWGEEYALRGKYVHDAALLVDCNQFAGIDERLANYVTAYRKFLDALRPDYADSEVMCCDPRRRLAGRIDRLVTRLARRRRKLILELKTGHKAPWHRWQLALYMLLKPTYIERAAVYLHDDGTFDVDDTLNTPAQWREDRDIVTHALAIIHARLKHNDRTIFDNRRLVTNAAEYDDTGTTGAGVGGVAIGAAGHRRSDEGEGYGGQADHRERDRPREGAAEVVRFQNRPEDGD